MLLCAAALAVASSGCAVRHQNNRTIIGLDHAAVFGTEYAKFSLADGSEGTLRSLGDVYSLKLDKYFKVVPLGRASSMEIGRIEPLEGRSVLVLHQLDKGGCVTTTVLAIRGSEVLSWSIKSQDCKSLPEITVADGRMLLRYTDKRFLYADGRILEEKAVPREQPSTSLPISSTKYPAPTASGKATSSARIRPPATHDSAGSIARIPPNVTVPPSSKTASVPAPSRSAPAIPDLTFSSSAQEQKPVVIHLE